MASDFSLVETPISNDARRLAELLRNKTLSDEDREFIVSEVQSLNQTTSGEYIYSVLFPEYSDPVRFPMIFPNPTAVFRHHDHFEFKPGEEKKFWINFFPQITSNSEDDPENSEYFLRIYMDWDNALNADRGGFDEAESGEYLTYRDSIGDYFEQVALRAAVIRVFYIGADEQLAGYFQSCIDYYYDSNFEKVPHPDDIEAGYYKQFAYPKEGLRQIWFPKDFNDYNFRSTKSTDEKTSRICIMGSGLDNTQKVRVDVIRHFEGFPRQKIRDYVDVRRPSNAYSQKTMESLGQVHSAAPELMTIKPMFAGEVAKKLKPKLSTFDRFLTTVGSVAQGVSNIMGVIRAVSGVTARSGLLI